MPHRILAATLVATALVLPFAGTASADTSTSSDIQPSPDGWEGWRPQPCPTGTAIVGLKSEPIGDNAAGAYNISVRCGPVR